ncbi:putative S-adenosyl-L-methionine-dependent methyltransferase-domain-containing protein [Blastocladiella britannica]|nr:putative S-adenosyl-L-methionine-dependent methyltransferase-domain-containing protein [Blastocladiella britannica]
MANVLDHVREHHPALYEHARYTIIEISANLAAIQRKTASDKGHTSCVHIVNESVFGDELGGTSTSAEVTDDGPCTVIALEVIDNLAHDVVRYDLATRAPLRGMVASDEYAEYSEEYVPVTAGAPAANGGHEDAALVRALALHAHVGAGGPGRGDPWWTATAALVSPRVRAAATAAIPFAPNLSRRAFVPTNLLVLFETLKRRFPRHSLVMSDFSSLPETTSPTERNAPVVQTRFERSMVPVSTYLVQPGFFDIFFPTEFETARRMYAAVMRDEYVVGRVTEAGERAIRDAERTGRSMRAGCLGDVLPSTFTAFPASVWSHRAFLEANADLKATTTRSGENPMLMYYENCAVMTS